MIRSSCHKRRLTFHLSIFQDLKKNPCSVTEYRKILNENIPTIHLPKNPPNSWFSINNDEIKPPSNKINFKFSNSVLKCLFLPILLLPPVKFFPFVIFLSTYSSSYSIYKCIWVAILFEVSMIIPPKIRRLLEFIPSRCQTAHTKAWTWSIIK